MHPLHSASTFEHHPVLYLKLPNPSDSAIQANSPITNVSRMAPLKSKTGGGTHTHNLRKGAGGANHTHNLRKIAGRGTNTQKLLKPYVTQRKRPKAEAAKKVINFLELPREIRDMIFDLAMCVDGVLVPYREKDDHHFLDNGGPPPSLALLRVNKQIREQARMCMLRVNTWRITEPWPLRPGVLWQINP